MEFIEVTCPKCKEKRAIHIWQTKRSRYTGMCRYCSQHDREFLHRTLHVKRQRDAVVINRGYIMVVSKGHPRASSGGYVRQCVLIMEKYLGRYLNTNEHVHHVNSVRIDDRIENLIIVTNSEHAKLYGLGILIGRGRKTL